MPHILFLSLWVGEMSHVFLKSAGPQDSVSAAAPIQKAPAGACEPGRLRGGLGTGPGQERSHGARHRVKPVELRILAACGTSAHSSPGGEPGPGSRPPAAFFQLRAHWSFRPPWSIHLFIHSPPAFFHSNGLSDRGTRGQLRKGPDPVSDGSLLWAKPAARGPSASFPKRKPEAQHGIHH